MARVFLGVGSNVRREENIVSGLQALQEQLDIIGMSSLYESEAIGFDGDAFYNMVIKVETSLAIQSLQSFLRHIEMMHGRKPENQGAGPRQLDIDILLYDDAVGNFDGVLLPRDEILRNAFVLWPMAEIAPMDIHPLEKKSYSLLWDEYDKSQQSIARIGDGIRKIA